MQTQAHTQTHPRQSHRILIGCNPLVAYECI